MGAESGPPLMQLWSEHITAHPTASRTANALILGMAVWISGLLAYSIIGLKAALAYIGSLITYSWLLYIPVMVLGLQYFHRNYIKELEGFRPYLKIPNKAFSDLVHRLDFLVCNPWIVFISAALLTDYFELTSATLTPFQLLAQQLGSGRIPTSDALWGTGQSYLNWLLLSTGIWLVVSIWLGIYLVSRRPLNFTPARFSNEFRDLAMLNLKTTGFYFLGLAIPSVLIYFESSNKHFDPLSLAFFYALIIPGVIGFFAPHYIIHRTLRNSKLSELERLDKEMTRDAAKLHDLHLNKSEDLQEYVKLSSRLIALSANERRIADADDWPLDHSMITTFVAFVIIPVIVNLVTNPPPGFP
jgi:hypothetical protein